MKNIKQLIEDHWKYIHDLLKAHDADAKTLKLCEFHYKSAFEHGYKHAMEEKHG